MSIAKHSKRGIPPEAFSYWEFCAWKSIHTPMGPKRSYTEMQKDNVASTSPFMPMFETFRAELDEHHDRRERIIKASRDITAASKKM